MSRRDENAGRVRRRLLGLAVLATILTSLALAGRLTATSATSAAAAQGAGGETIPETDDSLPLKDVTMIGSEETGETWGIGEYETTGGVSYELVRYNPEQGWSLGPQLLEKPETPLKGFEPDKPIGLVAASPLAGQMTPKGSGVLVGTVPPTEGGVRQQVALVRNPGGSFEETPPIEEALLGHGEALFSTTRAPLIAPLDEEDGRAGAFVVPVDKGGIEDGVLHWDGQTWTREEIEVPGESPEEKEASGFQVLGIGASSPENAWLVAQSSQSSEGLVLYRRVGDVWKPVSPAPLQVDGEALSVFGSPEKLESQVLTVTGQGVWVDGARPAVDVGTTIFFKPEAELKGSVSGSWCPVPSEGEACEHELPEALPTGPSRSFAWASSSTPYGERVITGLHEGSSLRLEETTFKPVLALGGSNPPEDPGGSLGAAFSKATDGWLGSAGLPVHLTLGQPSEGYSESDVKPWPVPFRHALFAVAPEPGKPVGVECSEALAVGDSGEVARYTVIEEANEKCKPVGWEPETLFGPGGRRETGVRLRAVAWPTANRAYAVGDESEAGHPQMWLWRGETGLWEPDPATPLNFRGSLLGIAFDPEEPSRGYAVGSDGVLLRYGKTWTQEALPEAAQGASFTSIAFAGSEALVAFHKNIEGAGRVGGLLVNDGSGWQVDEAAAAAMGKQVPTTVAGLPDGAAAVATLKGAVAQIYERDGPSDAWQPTAPLPPAGGTAPGSLALFHEGEALRVLAAGAAPVGQEVIAAPPPGFPPTIEEPLPVPSTDQERGIVRQTADGWTDEEHELNLVKDPPAPYAEIDGVYQPDPIDALLIGPTGSEGWALGGEVNTQVALDTSDVERYEASGAAQPSPPGVEASEPSPENPAEPFASAVTLAIGGGAQCNAPCADRADAKIGPDVWLSHAFEAAGDVHGVRAFLYTGARLSTGATEGPEPPYPFAREFARYVELLGAGASLRNPLPIFAAASPTDLDARPGGGTESMFEQSFASSQETPEPLGAGLLGAGAFADLSLAPDGKPDDHRECPGSPEGCLYYSFESKGEDGTVRVIVLDDTGNVGSEQLEWLEEQLGEVKSQTAEAAIVIGNASPDAAVAEALVNGGALAYFYDSPEDNVEGRLGAGTDEVKTFGSGTLGYITASKPLAQFQASGFLLAEVNPGQKEQVPGRGLHVSLIPNIGELALEAESGTLLRRSEVALFSALARRPRSGNGSPRGQFSPTTDPYVKLPSECIGGECPMRPDYEFRSSNEEVGQFVERNLSSPEPNVPELTSAGVTIPDSHSGLFCAYKHGATVVSILAGGLTSKLDVTVQEGSERRPCVPPFPLTKPAKEQKPVTAPTPAPSPAPAGTAPAAAPVAVLPPPPALPAPPAAPRPAATIPPFFVPSLAPSPVLAFVPPPVPTPARPTPPSGTSAVTSPVEVAEREEEHEEAPESVSNKAVAYTAPEQEPSPAFVLGIVLLAAIAGASVRRRGRSSGREVRVAPATLNSMRQQRRNGRDALR